VVPVTKPYPFSISRHTAAVYEHKCFVAVAVGVILWCGFEEPFAHVAVQKVLSSAPGTHFYVSLVVCFEMSLEINITWEAQSANRVI
jgi:hypothetical protein